MDTVAGLNEYYRVMAGQHRDPHEILGMHLMRQAGQNVVVVRVFRPDCSAVNFVDPSKDEVFPMSRIHEDGFFELIIPYASEIFPYELDACDAHSGKWTRNHDPYAFLPVITEFDRHLFSEGTNYRVFEKMGARPVELNGVKGTTFAVWAPNARRVSLIGSFNGWDASIHQMRNLGQSGIWEIFIPGAGPGATYKFEIKTFDNHLVDKADPFGLHMQLPPKTASVVWGLEYTWNDADWIAKRPTRNHRKSPMNIYEVHLGSWLRDGEDWLNYRELAERLVNYCKTMNYTHIELLPVSEHPFYGSWGYQVVGYYAPSSRYGKPQDFMYFVDYCHQHDISVILDWVPAHFPKDVHGLGRFDGTALYEHLDPRQGEHKDWGTLIYNYGRNQVKNFLISNLIYWCEYYHIDGFRVDAVASMLYLDYSRKDGEWVANEYGGRENLDAIDFIRQSNDIVHESYPGVIMIAEESTSWPMVSRPTHLGGLGFDFKWNMGWMNDMLAFMQMDPIFRKFHMSKITFGIFYAFSENFILVLSHDEVVHGKKSLLNKMPGDTWQKFANLRLFYAYWLAHPGKKLLFMGGDFGQQIEWNHDQALDWHLLDYPTHKGLHSYMRDMFRLYNQEPSLHQVDFEHTGFEWIDFSDAENTIVSFMRKTDNPWETLVFVFNFTPQERRFYQVGLPYAGRYSEVMNSDSQYYGGSNMGNGGEILAEPAWAQNQPFSVHMTLPPLAMVALKPLDVPRTIKTKIGQGKPLVVYTMPEGIPMPEPKPKVKTVKKSPGTKINKEAKKPAPKKGKMPEK